MSDKVYYKIKKDPAVKLFESAESLNNGLITMLVKCVALFHIHRRSTKVLNNYQVMDPKKTRSGKSTVEFKQV